MPFDRARIAAFIDRFTGTRHAARLFPEYLRGKAYGVQSLQEIALRKLTNPGLSHTLEVRYADFCNVYDQLVTPLYDCMMEMTIGFRSAEGHAAQIIVTSRWSLDPRVTSVDECHTTRDLVHRLCMGYWHRWPGRVVLPFVDKLDEAGTLQRDYHCPIDKSVHRATYAWDESADDVWPVGGKLTVVTLWPDIPAPVKAAVRKEGRRDAVGVSEYLDAGVDRHFPWMDFAQYQEHRPQLFRNPKMQYIFDEEFMQCLGMSCTIKQLKEWRNTFG